MNVSTKSKRDRFLHQYAWDLEHRTGDNDGILIQAIESVTGRLVISIELGENTTARQLRNAEPLAMQWRERLNEFQGRSFKQISVFNEALRFANSGMTCTEIARYFNKKISDLLRSYAEHPDKDAFAAISLRWDALYILWNLYTGDDRKARRGPYSKDEKKLAWKWANDIIEYALKEIAKGKEPFDTPDFPLSGDSVKSVVTQWQRKKGNAKT